MSSNEENKPMKNHWEDVSQASRGNHMIITKGYFVPEIEDINVGYEGEIYRERDNSWWDIKTVMLKEGFSVDHLLKKAYNKQIRVPYLTSDQIEKEGWKYTGAKGYYLFGYDHVQGFHNAFEKGDYIIQGRALFGSHHIIKIFNTSDQEGAHCVYEGECKDINTFRKLSKLLGI